MATNKQKALAKKILENPSSTMKDAMLAVGYAENTAIAPQNVTESKGWHELMEKYLPDEKLLEVHQNGLEASKIHSSHTEPDKTVPDYPTQAKFLDLAYKVKKHVGGEAPKVQINNFIPLLGGDSIHGLPTDNSDK